MRVQLNGIVASDEDCDIYQYFGYDAFSPRTIRDAISNNPAGEPLVLEINSGGGSVFAGFEMYSILKTAGNVTAEIQSLAASAASVMMCGAARVIASPVAQVMIHLPSTITDGNRDEHRNTIHILDSLTESILNAYEEKCGGKKTRDEFRRMMEKSTWMPAHEAMDCGLVDSILTAEDSPLDFVAACGLPDITEMRARYRAMKNETHEIEWQMKAALEIEKERGI